MKKDKIVQLHLFWDNRQQQVISLDHPDDIVIGTASRADIHVPDPNVSFVHCLVRFTDSCQCYIRDLNSTNGTMLNGKTVDGIKPLYSGDLIQFGYITMLFLIVTGKQESHVYAS